MAREAAPYLEHYLDYTSVTAELERWEREYPALVRRRSLGKTPEGRDIWCVTVGEQPEKARPGLLVGAGQHAAELAGTNVALAIGDALLRLLTEPGAPRHDLPPAAVAELRRPLLHIIPRISPDGAEQILLGGGTVRSVPRDRPSRPAARWRSQDLDGDGVIRTMRKRDPSGELVPSKVIDGLMVPRQLGDEGPFYKVWPEGIIEGFDGGNVPTPRYLCDNYPDLNRNFPYDWRPEEEQVGAGEHPLSEPESAAIARFATETPSLFGWIDYHTFGGVFIRPLGTSPDSKLDPQDFAFFRQLEAWAQTLTGYPMVSGFEQFTYEPEKPLRGDLTEYAYHQRGTIAFVVELWDLFNRVGLPPQKRFVDRYTHIDREDLESIARWASEHADPSFLTPWRLFEHPQLGTVEIGGFDKRFVISNPPAKLLPELCSGHVALALRLLACAPHIEITDITIRDLGAARCVDLSIRNTGYLPTAPAAAARRTIAEDPLEVFAEGRGCEVISPTGPVQIGLLSGWGRGRYAGFELDGHSEGTTSERRLRYVVRGEGTLLIRACNRRMGEVTAEIPIAAPVP